MAKQKQKPHLKNKNPLLADTERVESPVQPTEAIDTLEAPKAAARRGKSDRPKGRRR
ncbi:hypothetical protein [Embleya hyalina]|uniref:Uncharacterized protein n=1 Tax=Embleya hyalina TaxID=516124 RepID=A0A401YFQ1_9ACTN|nr:hypothetical protein [Embleya hyalina]GCD93400.1 hypothetical protein EHYA_01044 [Embleya hyalina]